VFSLLVVLYLFLAGCGGGLLLVSSLLSLIFHSSSSRTSEDTTDFTALKNRCFLVGLLLVLLAASSLVVDLGRPERLFLLLLRPTPTVLSFGSYVLLTTVLLGFILVIINYFYLPAITSKVKKTVELLCVIAAFLLVVYVGVYLQEMKSIPFWNTFAIPVLFVLSSVSAGLTLLCMLTSLTNGRKRIRNIVRKLHKSQAVVLLLEAVTLTAFLWLSTYDSTATRSLQLLFGDGLRLWFLGAVGLGIILPLIQSILSVIVKKMPGLPMVDMVCLFGGFCLRYCIIYAGVY
jgi:formate-dependent nitrite reductase membrane component NrfD